MQAEYATADGVLVDAAFAAAPATPEGLEWPLQAATAMSRTAAPAAASASLAGRRMLI
jgi:hypothetical protein